MQGLKFFIIGIDNNEKDFITTEGKAVLDSCDYLFVSRRFLSRFVNFKGKKKPHSFPEKLSDLPALIKEFLIKDQKKNGTIAIFATGDPNFFGITPFISKNFPDAEIKVYPNISTMQRAFARLALNWDDAAFGSLHGRKTENLLSFFLKNKKGFLFTSNAEDVLVTLRCLKENRLDDYTVYIIENLGTDQENIIKITYPFLLKQPISDLNVVIFIRERALGTYPGIGIPEEQFKSVGGMITKKEVRTNVVSMLSLREGCVLWDIGAGSGSVSIEATFNPVGTLAFAIEKNEEAYLNLKENLKRFSAHNVKPIFADFIDVYHSLPSPDRIFIGGGKISKNLPPAFEKLKEGGIIVIAILSMENLAESMSFAEKESSGYELTQVSIVRKEVVKDISLFKASNPVFLMRIKK